MLKTNQAKTYEVIRIIPGSNSYRFEKLLTFEAPNDPEIFAVHQNRIIINQDVYEISNTFELSHLMQLGEYDATYCLPLNDHYFVLGHQRYFQFTLWKWSEEDHAYTKTQKYRFSTNGENALEVRKIQKCQLQNTKDHIDLIMNVGHHNLYEMSLSIEEMGASKKLKLHHGKKTKLLDFEQLTSSNAQQQFLVAITDKSLIVINMVNKQELY